MAQRIPWDISESVIMLDALISVLDGHISRKDAIDNVSATLRSRAEGNGVEITDIFRNTNGIALQMSKMEYVLTDGASGLGRDPLSKVFQEAIDLYRNNKDEYERVLKEATVVPSEKSIRDRYFEWLASKVSPLQLSNYYLLYEEIDKFCMSRNVVKKKLFDLKILSDVRKVVSTVDSSKVFSFTYKRDVNKMRTAIHQYYTFFKENMPLSSDSAGEQAKTAMATAEKQPESQTVSTPVRETPRPQTEECVLSLGGDTALAFTRPTEFSYFGEQNGSVNSWTDLYVAVVTCLLEDYEAKLLPLINSNISRQGRCDFADDSMVGTMVAPKKVRDSFYLETNLSATDIVSKIRRMLDICSVDYENLVIKYINRKHTEPVSSSAEVSAATRAYPDSDPLSKLKAQFVDWMIKHDSSEKTATNYFSAIKTIGIYAAQYGICSDSLYMIEDADRLRQILKELLDNPTFHALNLEQHNRFRAALSKLIVFRSDATTPSGAADIQPEPPAAEPEKVTSTRTIPNEVVERCKEILAEYFGEDGYQPGRPIFRGRFKRYYSEKYGCEFEENDAALDLMLEYYGVKRDGRIYPKKDSEQNDLMADIISEIMNAYDSGATAVYVESVYDRHSQRLADDLHIYNQDAFSSLLLSQAKGKFFKSYTYLVKAGTDADAPADLRRAMKEFHQPVTYDQIHEKVWFIPLSRIKYFLATDMCFANVDAETYFYAPNLPVSAEELAHLSSLMNAELSGRSYITDVRLMELIAEKCPTIAINTDGFSGFGLRNCLAYLLREQFTFTGPIISPKGSVVSTGNVYAEFAREHETMQLDDLTRLSTEINVGIYWENVLTETIRITETQFVRKDLLHFDVAAIDAVLETMCPGEYVALKDVNLFLHMPNVGYPWNSYLLESYLYTISKKYRLLHASFSKSAVFGAMVRVDSSIQDYRSLLVDVLSKSNVLHSSKAALQYIVDKGYQQRRRYEGIDALIQEAKLQKEQREKQEK